MGSSRSSTTCGALTAPPDDELFPDSPFPQDGRSLTAEEYIDAFLRWVRWQRLDRERSLDDALRDEQAAREGLEEEIASTESLSAIKRFAAGEPWEEIRESMITGRRYEPVTWL